MNIIKSLQLGTDGFLFMESDFDIWSRFLELKLLHLV
jgi:hypothetical protein